MDVNEQKYKFWKTISITWSISTCLFMAGTIYFLVRCYNQNQFIYEQWADYNNKLTSSQSRSLILDESFDCKMRRLFDEVSLAPRSSLFTYFDRDFFSDRFGANSLLDNFTIESSDKEYLITMAVPGFTKEQVKIELQGNVLTILADNSSESSDENSGKKNINKFRQSITLSNDIERDLIKSSLKDGILTINIARSKQLSEPKTIIIE